MADAPTILDNEEVLNARLPGRKHQIRNLLSIVNPTIGIASCNAAFVYGVAASGKSTITVEVLKANKVKYAVVNCVETCTPRILFEQLLNQIGSHKGYKCESLSAFVLMLTQVLAYQNDEDVAVPTTTYIVFDNAERLRSLPPNILPAILRLSELTGKRVCTMLISGLIWEKFRGGTGLLEPYLIQFAAYDREATLQIIALDCTCSDKMFFRQFCLLLWNVFHGPCRDLNELRHLVALLFPIYHEPVLAGTTHRDNTAALYKHIKPHLNKQLNKLYLRETSSIEWRSSQANDDAEAIHSLVTREVELPFISKYLLVSAFLSSYNPARSDYRIFAKRQMKKTNRRKGGGAKKEKIPQYLVGPKPFALERLLAIMFSLLQIETGKTTGVARTGIDSQLSTLVSLKMIAQVSSTDNLDAPKYKCLMPLAEVKRLALSIEVDLSGFLFDSMV
eukprot:m.264207 g.264207  ORF g.264207 m.264207 type:complete len:448 (-) comp54518_c0_seq1:146-1489(-)